MSYSAQEPRSRTRWPLALAVAAVCGCSGTIGQDPAPGTSPRPDDTPSTETPGKPMGGQSGTAAPPPSVPPAPVGACRDVPPRARLWRMTPEQYALTMRSLFGISDVRASDLPQDAIDAITGFSNGAGSSYAGTAHVRKFLPLADQAADSVEAGLATSHPCLAGTNPDEACARSFVSTMGKRAFRRPLDADEQTRYLRLFQEARVAFGAKEAAGVVTRALVMSPSFFHLSERGDPSAAGTRVKLTPHELASALSYALTDEPPPPDLMAAADAGRLSGRELESFARKLALTESARQKMGRFIYWQLHLHKLEDDRDKFGSPMVDSMLAETQRFVSAVLTEEKGSLQSLLTGSFGYPDARLAPVYGVTPSGSTGAPGRVTFDPAERFGVFTLAGALAAEHGPIHRGRAFRESFLCQLIPPPGEDAVALMNDLPAVPAGATEAESWDIFQKERPACAGCHQLFHPIGVAFDAYDAAGKHRTKNAAGRAIRVAGSVTGAQGWSGQFEDARDLAAQVATSAAGRACFAQRYLTFVAGRVVDTTSDCHGAALARTLIGGQDDLRELMVATATHEHFFTRARE